MPAWPALAGKVPPELAENVPELAGWVDWMDWVDRIEPAELADLGGMTWGLVLGSPATARKLLAGGRLPKVVTGKGGLPVAGVEMLGGDAGFESDRAGRMILGVPVRKMN